MFGIIVTGVYNIFRVHNLMATKQEETTKMQQELLTTLIIISDDLRMCGYKPLNSNSDFGLKIGTSDLGTNQESIYCTRGRTTTSENATVEIAYKKNNSNQILSYNTSNSSWIVASDNISEIKFAYFNSDEEELSIPLNATTARDVRMIEINATATASQSRSNMNIRDRNMSTRVWLRNLDF